jgi:hypothetical protein
MYDTRIIQHTIPLRPEVKSIPTKTKEISSVSGAPDVEGAQKIVGCQDNISSETFCMGSQLSAH